MKIKFKNKTFEISNGIVLLTRKHCIESNMKFLETTLKESNYDFFKESFLSFLMDFSRHNKDIFNGKFDHSQDFICSSVCLVNPEFDCIHCNEIDVIDTEINQERAKLTNSDLPDLDSFVF